MILGSTASTIENIIPYVILAVVVIFIALRLGGPLIDALVQARKRKNEHTE